MTTPRRSQIVVANPSTLQGANAASWCRRHGRGDTLFESQLGTIGNVEPWPYTVDSNGQSYPSGLLGVSFSTVADPALYASTLIAVPDTLPAGYLSRSARDIARGIGQDSTVGQFAPFSLTSYIGAFCTGWLSTGTGANQAPRIRGTAGLTSYPFFPENQGSNAFTYLDNFADGPNAFLSGLRYFRTTVVGFNSGFFDPVLYDYGEFQVVRWSNPAAVMQPNTATGLFPVDATLWTSPHITADYDSGYLYDVTDLDLKAPAGTRCFFAMFFTLHTAATNPADPPNIWRFPTASHLGAARHYWGPRLDIPLPFTVCGEGNVIAPGGVVSGILPGYP
jgi:hypothetical protein